MEALDSKATSKMIEGMFAASNAKSLDDAKLIRAEILKQFTKDLDAKLKNLQDGEAIQATYRVDILTKDGKVRGGSGHERNMPEYAQWRTEVFERDEYTCQDCNELGGALQAHHIKPWATCPALRFDVSNGVTLCQRCHQLRHPHLRLIGAIPNKANT